MILPVEESSSSFPEIMENTHSKIKSSFSFSALLQFYDSQTKQSVTVKVDQ